MKALAFLGFSLLLVSTAAAADGGSPSAACNPWSANYWGDAVITSQAAADEYACFRRIVGSLTLIQSGPELIVMPELRGVLGNLRVVFAGSQAQLGPHQAVQAMLPALEELRGEAMLHYTRVEYSAALSGKR